MDENQEERIEYEIPDNDEELARERFVSNAENTEVFLIPQCVNCAHNKGLLSCAVYVQKPEEYMSNEADCPEFEE